MVDVAVPRAAEGGSVRPQRFRLNEEAAGPRPQRGRHRIRKVEKHRSFWKELPVLIIVALTLTFAIQTFVGRVYMIPSGSMESTLHGCPGCTPDRVLVDKMVYRFSDPEPGDVVVFQGPRPWTENDAPVTKPSSAFGRFMQQVAALFGVAPPDERDFVKRIIAIGGQTIECCDRKNRVLVDGVAVDEPYIHWDAGRAHRQQDFGPVTVPAAAVFVMGDNRNNSSDSRVQGGGGVRGTVPVENIIGKARVIVLPPGRWGAISDYNPQGDTG